MIYQKHKVHIILTGDTIDSYYNGINDTLKTLQHFAVPQFFELLKIDSAEFIFSEVCMKDSRRINEEDRKTILQEIENSAAEKIIITHGTYTMTDTARFIKANPKSAKTAILTDSTIPITGFPSSDAPFNLRFAFANCFTAEHSVYITKNGQMFDAEEVQKFLAEEKFASVYINNY